MFGQVLVMRLFKDHAIYSQICGNNLMVLKVAPAMVVNKAQVDEFVAAMEAVLADLCEVYDKIISEIDIEHFTPMKKWFEDFLKPMASE